MSSIQSAVSQQGNTVIENSGLGSGLDVNTLISELVSVDAQPLENLETQLQGIQSTQSSYDGVKTQINTLSANLTALTNANLGGTLNLFTNKAVTSSNATDATVTATNAANNGSFTLEVDNLATATTANSTTPTGQWTTGSSLISAVSGGAITAGNFTVYVNGSAQTVNVTTSETVQQVLNSIASAVNTADPSADATGSVTANGQLQISTADTPTLAFGANGDTSNFVQATQLSNNTVASVGSGQTVTANVGTSTINLNGTLVGNGAGLQNNTITAGTFTLGGATFTVNASTTLSDLISDINSDSSAGVFVSYNTATNAFQVVSTSTGNQTITMNDNGTGVLQSLGLMNDSTGNTLDSQTLGQNALFKINGGTQLQSASNTVSSSVTGLNGITLNLLNPTGMGTAINMAVSNDPTGVTNAVSTFVNDLNSALSSMSSLTAQGGTLQGNEPMNNLQSSIISQLTNSDNSLPDYQILSQIGITMNTSTAGSNGPISFSVDTSTLQSALASNPQEVQSLLTDPTNGILTNLLNNVVTPSLNPTNGMFASEDQSSSDQQATINANISTDETALEQYQTQLQTQFADMQTLISSLDSQKTALSSL